MMSRVPYSYSTQYAQSDCNAVPKGGFEPTIRFDLVRKEGFHPSSCLYPIVHCPSSLLLCLR